MNRFRCHKKVWAFKIALIDKVRDPLNYKQYLYRLFSSEVIEGANGPEMVLTEEITERPNWYARGDRPPEKGDYWVCYENLDGTTYTSWSPAPEFEAGYALDEAKGEDVE